MTETVIPVPIPGTLLEDFAQQAAQSGVSLGNWLVSVAEERVRDQRVSERFFQRRPQESDGKSLLSILDSANHGHPVPGDEL